MSSDTPVVVKAYRTPFGKEGGVFADVRPEDLSIPLIDQILGETGLTGEDVDDLKWGCAQQRSEQGNNMARVIALMSELGEDTPATTINRWCASSAEAIIDAANAIREIHPGLNDYHNLADLQMGMTAETVAERYDVTRETQDEYAAQSQQRAVAATEEGRFDDEIVPIEGHDEDGEEITVEKDEGLRPGTTVEKLAELPTVFKSDGTVTPGNASQMTDGAAALLVTSRSFAEEHGLEEIAEIGNNAVAGVEPEVMGIGPVPACRQLFDRSDTSVDDYDLVELNEAFASQCVYCRDELGFDNDIYNVNGGAIAIGHPLGATGARLPVTLIHEMHKRDADRGLATECVGFGQGAAIEFLVD
jgi:acetyl-CoA acetyltransferase